MCRALPDESCGVPDASSIFQYAHGDSAATAESIVVAFTSIAYGT